MTVPFEELERAYKQAITHNDLQCMPAPYGSRVALPPDTRLQLVEREEQNGKCTIFKHFIFPQKCKKAFFQTVTFGEAFKPTCAHAQAAGKKIMQYCFENMGAAFDDLEDRELDAGFDYLIKNGPRSGSDLRQLRWQTKELRRKESPVYNWPAGVVDKALRTLASDGALARKEFDWPLPLTSTFFKRWVLDILENVWDFDHSAFVLLGEPGAGKSPLGRSVLMAQCRRNAQSFEGDQRHGHHGDFLDDPSTSDLRIKALKSLLDVGLYESMSWARWGAVKWVQNQPRALAANSYDCDIQEGDDFTTLFKFEDFKKMIMCADDEKILKILAEDGLLPPWEKKVCPMCNIGKLSGDCKSEAVDSFDTAAVRSHPLQMQAAALMMRLANVPLSTIHILTNINHKALERMDKGLILTRKGFVEISEKEINFGGGNKWKDVEADEATFDKTTCAEQDGNTILWEQWAGIVARGKPQTLLHRLNPPATKARAPGPGAIRKVDWTPLARKHLQGKSIILHTDSARSYKLKIDGVVHDSVVHKKKLVIKNGKRSWKPPTYVKVVSHKLPGGKRLSVKAGTQIIDRAWRFIKDRLKANQNVKAGRVILRAQIRSAQYEYPRRARTCGPAQGI
ncbi:unnamed protein product [Effrenium voratum]|uniref:Uncharacterized protein n=1 Tax=Effrenium voratum TaxID=2562239 RepID=A0AA36HSM3_9DINO|nr:unnamed protein product [Effrenium voratum]